MNDYYIYRMERSRTKGWRLCVPGHPEVLFSDKSCGGREKARKAALQTRDELVPKLLGHRPFRMEPKRNNTSGIVGVCKYTDRGTMKGWKVHWGRRGRLKKLFPTVRYGTARKAKEAAIRFRMQKQIEMAGGKI